MDIGQDMGVDRILIIMEVVMNFLIIVAKYYVLLGYAHPIYFGGYNRPSIVYCESLYRNGYGWGPRVTDGRWVYGRCSDYDY